MKRSPQLDRYASFVGEDLLDRIYHVSESLAALHVIHVNTTSLGGGVAELLHSLIPLMQELGISHSWQVIPLDDFANQFSAHIADLLQGIDHEDIPVEQQRIFLDTLRHTQALHALEEMRADVYFIHDFQLVPLANFYPWMRPSIWMCHVDTANPDPGGKRYVEQFLPAYNICVFNTPISILEGLPREKTHVITPTIDPFSAKNAYIAPAEGMKMLERCGIDTTRPLITQVSRFSNWKKPWQVIDAYRLVKRKIPSVQVALVGAMEASDDIYAMEVLKDVQQMAADDPDIHLLYDPTEIQHPQVNAFQRYSNAILQRSTREGFGLTVTEAMWKYQPVIGTSATGLRTQIKDGRNGFIADDTETCAEDTLKLIQDRNLWSKLGKQANMDVKENYLLPVMVLQYLNALIKARASG